MNTNYSKWAKFDVEKALQDTESRGEDEDIRAECAKKSLEHEKQLQSLQETSKQSAAALRSKVLRLQTTSLNPTPFSLLHCLLFLNLLFLMCSISRWPWKL